MLTRSAILSLRPIAAPKRSAEQRGVDRAWAHGVDADTVSCELECEATCEPVKEQPPSTPCRRRIAWPRQEQAGGVTETRQDGEVREDCAAGEVIGHQVGIEDAAPVGRGRLPEGALVLNTYRIDEEVDAPVGACYLAHRRSDRPSSRASSSTPLTRAPPI